MFELMIADRFKATIPEKIRECLCYQEGTEWFKVAKLGPLTDTYNTNQSYAPSTHVNSDIRSRQSGTTGSMGVFTACLERLVVIPSQIFPYFFNIFVKNCHNILVFGILYRLLKCVIPNIQMII